MDYMFHRGPVIRIFPTEEERSTLRDADGGSSHLVRDTDLPPPVKRRRTMSDPDFIKKASSAMNSALACLEFMKTAGSFSIPLKPGAVVRPPTPAPAPIPATQAALRTPGGRAAALKASPPANVQQVVSPKPAPAPAPVSQASPAAHPAAVPPAPATATPPPPPPPAPTTAQPAQAAAQAPAGPAVDERAKRAKALMELRATKHEARNVRKDLQSRMGKMESSAREQQTAAKGQQEELGRLREIAAGTTPEELAKFQKATGTATPSGWKSTAWDVGSMMVPMMAAGMVLPPSLQLPAMLALQMGGHQKLREFGQKKMFGYAGDTEAAAAKAAWARGQSPEQYLAAAKARQEAAAAPAPAAA